MRAPSISKKRAQIFAGPAGKLLDKLRTQEVHYEWYNRTLLESVLQSSVQYNVPWASEGFQDSHALVQLQLRKLSIDAPS